jgi:alpha-beta hydrolase superfamily lysophospholipase/GNAT superfamily N-acetyltransferase
VTTPVTVGVANPRATDVAAALGALTAELAESEYTADQTFGYSADQLEQQGVHLVAARVGETLVAVGGIELQDGPYAELKRFWVDPIHRGTGAADAVMAAVLDHALAHGRRIVRLETGDRQHAAVRFYGRHGFVVVDRFPPYEASVTSVCMQRMIRRMPDDTFRFTGTDDTPITAYEWRPDGTPRAIVQLTHGMGEHALRYDHLARALTAHGAVVVAQDHRGHGESVIEGREAGDLGPDGWSALVQDIGVLTRHVRDAHAGLPLVLLGHSMGSFAVQQHLLDHSADVDAAILSGTAAIDLLEPALDLDQPMSLESFNDPFQPARTDFDWLSRDDAQVDAYVADPLCGFGIDQSSGKAMFVAARPLSDPAVVARMRRDLPVLVAVGDADPVNGGMVLANALQQRYDAALDDVTLIAYPGARHEVFNETNRDQVEADVVAWIAARTPLG